MKRLRRRVAPAPLELMMWCRIDAHAGYSGDDLMLCPGGKPPGKLRCDCDCHDDVAKQNEALDVAKALRESITSPKPTTKKRRLKRVKS
ncbi:hypothetical protein PBI_CANTARE_66 [Brevibacterium phage Cantare]|uniref:Uncharacterized protein n=1 Tax=Brevibacterium phage Cantare TaxID=2338395 RepID=A0A3G3LYV0_9CAUD|nr:hypothetical protein PQD70_gp066 [Brevibacterium phage Cantare]AYQ99286.1 hypothetical protein PBI_CANTARE_66 [Brevibacterium phage Cantare]